MTAFFSSATDRLEELAHSCGRCEVQQPVCTGGGRLSLTDRSTNEKMIRVPYFSKIPAVRVVWKSREGQV